MVFYHLTSLAAVKTALDTVSNVHGGYRALGLLADALEGVETPDEFEEELNDLRNRQGPSYEGPEDADRQLLKAAHTAAHEEGEKQDALLKLMALVLTRLGTSQGTRILSMLLLAAGMNPLMMQVVIKLCLLLAQTEAGQRMILGSRSRFRELLPMADKNRDLRQRLVALSSTLGERSSELWGSTSSFVASLRDQAAQTARDWLPFDALTREPGERDETRG